MTAMLFPNVAGFMLGYSWVFTFLWNTASLLKVFIYFQKRRKLGLGFSVGCGIPDFHESWPSFSWRIPLSALLIWASDYLCSCPRPLEWGLHESRACPLKLFQAPQHPIHYLTQRWCSKNIYWLIIQETPYILIRYLENSIGLDFYTKGKCIAW